MPASAVLLSAFVLAGVLPLCGAANAEQLSWEQTLALGDMTRNGLGALSRPDYQYGIIGLGGTTLRVGPHGFTSPGAPSVLQHGLRIGDPGVFSDEGWGFGYGNFVIVGYHHDVLPPSTRKVLAEKGFPGGSLYVMYAHLQRRAVNHGDQLAPNNIIGFAGNSGNSEATHLHLEVRMGKSASFPGWAALSRNNLVNPGVLFSR